MSESQGAEDEGERASREVSSIAFPYFDLDEAIKVARAMLDRGGGVAMDRDQVAAATNSAGGTFANKLSAARQFGLIDTQQGKWALTSLGYDIIDPSRERAAKSEAFLNVELYKRAYDEYRGRVLPTKPGLENAFVSFGVAPKQREKARQTFERSARSAGYFHNGSEDRLVQPIVGGAPSVITREEPESPSSPELRVVTPAPAQAFVARPETSIHQSISHWVSDLPAPGSEWSKEDQADWLQALAQLFRSIYDSDRSERITVSVERRSN